MSLLEPNGLGEVQNQPSNINFLFVHRFRIVLWRSPAVRYFVQECNFPGMAMGNASQATPFVDIPQPGDKIQFEDFHMTFPVDENMQNYREIGTWLVGLGFPRAYGQYAELAESKIGLKSDISLMILDSNFQPAHTVTFHDAFPTALSGIQFDTKVTDVNIPLATATFKYSFYEYDDVNTITAKTPVTQADSL